MLLESTPLLQPLLIGLMAVPLLPSDAFRFADLLLFTTAFHVDALATLWGQGVLYWAGYY